MSLHFVWGKYVKKGFLALSRQKKKKITRRHVLVLKFIEDFLTILIMYLFFFSAALAKLWISAQNVLRVSSCSFACGFCWLTVCPAYSEVELVRLNLESESCFTSDSDVSSWNGLIHSLKFASQTLARDFFLLKTFWHSTRQTCLSWLCSAKNRGCGRLKCNEQPRHNDFPPWHTPQTLLFFSHRHSEETTRRWVCTKDLLKLQQQPGGHVL